MIAEQKLGFTHRFEPASDPATAPTLLLLHGTGGDENDLLPLGASLLPNANRLSPRGNVLERGLPRFFRRLAEGVFDQEDLQFRIEELADFVGQAAQQYGFDASRVLAVGYSNGANIAAGMLLRLPKGLAGAVLFHPMVPFTPDALPDLTGKPVFISAGQSDPIVPAQNTQELANLLRAAGASVNLHWQPGGHTLASSEVEAARRWMALPQR